MTDPITAAKAKHARELARIEREEHVRTLLPDAPEGMRWRLFGQRTEVWAELEPFDRRGNPANLATLANLADDLPNALPLYMENKPGKRLAIDARPLPDDESHSRIAPVILDYQGAADYQPEAVTVRWWVKLTDGALVYRVRISLMLKLPITGLGRVEQERGGRWGRGPIKSSILRRPKALSGGILEEFPERDGYYSPMAMPDVVRWYRTAGSPGTFRLYFHPLGIKSPGPRDLARTLCGYEPDEE